MPAHVAIEPKNSSKGEGNTMIKDKDKRFLAKILTFWDKLDSKQKELLLDNTKQALFDEGTNIHSGKDDCAGVILVKSGGLRAYILSEEGKEITLYRFSSGDICILSSSCIFENIDFDIFVDSEVESEVLIIDSKIFERISNENIYAENFSYRKTIDRFSDVMSAIQQLLFLSVDKRLANFLCDEVSKAGIDTLLITHEEIAKHIGSVREVVSRTLKTFEKKGIVTLSRGKVKVVDKVKILEILETI